MKVTIIGAGISGLAAGCYLQRNGFETAIYEKHAIPGGLCTSWKKGDYVIDGCAHWIMGSGPGSSFFRIFNELIDMEKVPFYHHDVRMVIEVKNSADKYGSKQFKLYTNLDQLSDYLLDLSPEDAHLIRPFIKAMRDMQAYDLPPILDDLPLVKAAIRGIKMSRYIRFLPILLKWGRLTNYTFGDQFRSPFLREAFRLLYDHEEVKMLVMMMPLSFFDLKSCGYPLGGSYSFAKRFEESYISLGGKIHYKRSVKEIIVEGDEAKGIVLRDNTQVRSDLVLSCADWHFTVFDLLNGKYVNKAMQQLGQGKLMEVFYSVVQVSFGIDLDLSNYPHFLRYPLDEDIRSPDGTTYSRMELHLYHYDPVMAPPHKTTLVVSFYTMNRDYWIDLRNSNRKLYREKKIAFTEEILQRLERRFGAGFREKVEMTDMATPATLYRYTGNWKGSTQGWLPGKNLVAGSPVKFTLPGLSNFYYASHWSQPGGGLPVAVISARNVSKLICKRTKRVFTGIRVTAKG